MERGLGKIIIKRLIVVSGQTDIERRFCCLCTILHCWNILNPRQKNTINRKINNEWIILLVWKVGFFVIVVFGFFFFLEICASSNGLLFSCFLMVLALELQNFTDHCSNILNKLWQNLKKKKRTLSPKIMEKVISELIRVSKQTADRKREPALKSSSALPGPSLIPCKPCHWGTRWQLGYCPPPTTSLISKDLKRPQMLPKTTSPPTHSLIQPNMYITWELSKSCRCYMVPLNFSAFNRRLQQIQAALVQVGFGSHLGAKSFNKHKRFCP